MKSSNNKSGKALAVMAVFALSSMVASAAPVPSWVNGDIFLGIRASGSPDPDYSYLVKLGNDSTSFNSSGVLALGNLNADLADPNKYGANWSSRADLYWGIFGVRNPVGDPVLYVSRQRSSPSSPASPWSTLSSSRRRSTASVLNTVIQSTSGVPSGYGGLQATPNSPVAAFQTTTGSELSPQASYKYQVTTGANDFGSTSGWSNIEGNFGAGAAATVLDVFRISDPDTDTGVTLFGTFTITSAGVITFTKATASPVDKDGDGFFDFEEELAGTSDNDSSDYFRVGSVSKGTSGNATLTFNAIPSRLYKVYYREDLGIGSWELIDTVTSGPYTDTNAVRNARSKGFYKVAVTTAP